MFRRDASLYSSARVLPPPADCLRPVLDPRFVVEDRFVLELRAVLAARLVPELRLAPEVRFAPAERVGLDDRAAAVRARFVEADLVDEDFRVEVRAALDFRRLLPSAASCPVPPRRSFSLVRRRLRVFSFGLSYFEAPASCRAIAIACFGFFTFLLPRAVFSSPCLNSCITRSIVSFCAGLWCRAIACSRTVEQHSSGKTAGAVTVRDAANFDLVP